MPKIVNAEYRLFLDTGLINILTEDEFNRLLLAVDHDNIRQACVMLSLLYYTGRRPSEILELQSSDFEKDGTNLRIRVQTKKKGVGGIIYLPLNQDSIQDIWDYVSLLPPNMYVLWEFRGDSPKTIKIKRKDGTEIYREYNDTTYKVRYWVKKWSTRIGKPLVPYFFRHNRLSDLAMKGADINELKFFKGSKTLASVEPYMHLSQKKAKRLAKLI